MPKNEIQPGVGGIAGPKRGDTSTKTTAATHESVELTEIAGHSAEIDSVTGFAAEISNLTGRI